MKPRTGIVALPLIGVLLLSAPAPGASASGAGGVVAGSGSVPSSTRGGAQYGAVVRQAPSRPSVRLARLASATVTAGQRPSLEVRVARRGASSARVRALVAPTGSTRGRPAATGLRRVAVNETVAIALPSTLRPGRYSVRLEAVGAVGELPTRSKALRLVVKRKPKPAPETPSPSPPPPPPPGLPPESVPPPFATTTAGVFPVQGPYSFGGADGRFGAGRTGHIHEGQDITAAEGVPVVAPLPGEVLFNDYQAGGAGRYVVLAAANGWHMFFAHCIKASADVRPGQRVTAGERLCNVGSTGYSTGPHLHFELWPQGWRHLKGTRPVDPLPQLRVWAR
ncbi:MAG: M23 family metallopeptidase [Solirubrobacteraceae bacterium]|nr:M23 family metallopeptidase [Solirubrobacteraceae bacterium]